MKTTNNSARNRNAINKNTPMLFCNIGWMMNYNGPTNDDKIIGGGSFEDKSKHEIYNFQNNKGKCYGYVQPGGRMINLKRINPSITPDTEKIKGVMVVWLACDKANRGSRVVGWYKNATVYRYYQKLNDGSRRNYSYYVEAAFQDCTLLPVDERNYPIPRRQKGFFGQSNIWYADSAEKDVCLFREKTIRYICGYVKGLQVSRPIHSYKPDVELNKKIETAAVKSVIKFYEKKGYIVRSVEKENKGWDLEATHKDSEKKLLLEVKGQSGSEPHIRISENEYDKMQGNRRYRLCVVLNALTNPMVYVFLLNISGTKWVWEQNEDTQLSIDEKVAAVATF